MILALVLLYVVSLVYISITERFRSHPCKPTSEA